MFDLGKLFIPTSVEYKPATGKITLQTPEFQTEDYFNDIVCNLTLEIFGTYIHIDYKCEGDTFLSYWLDDLIGPDNELILDDAPDLNGIAHGDLTEETFQEIQNRALKKLAEHMDDAEQEFVQHFDNL